jgi:hypothetical protein
MITRLLRNYLQKQSDDVAAFFIVLSKHLKLIYSPKFLML